MPTTRTGKTGSDAIFKALHRISVVLSHYAPKFIQTISIMEAAGTLSAAEAAVVRAFLTDFTALVAALAKMADYTNV